MFPHLEPSLLAEVANTFGNVNIDHTRLAHATKAIVDEMNRDVSNHISMDYLAHVFRSVVPHPPPFQPPVLSSVTGAEVPWQLVPAHSALGQAMEGLESAKRRERAAKELEMDHASRIETGELMDPEEDEDLIQLKIGVMQEANRTHVSQNAVDQTYGSFRQVLEALKATHERQYSEHLASVLLWNEQCYNVFPAMIHKVYMNQPYMDTYGNVL